jgi:hypothetical protein
MFKFSTGTSEVSDFSVPHEIRLSIKMDKGAKRWGFFMIWGLSMLKDI